MELQICVRIKVYVETIKGRVKILPFLVYSVLQKCSIFKGFKGVLYVVRNTLFSTLQHFVTIKYVSCY